MAPTIWGLDLAEITLSKFGSANMRSTTYHLRRTKFAFYQLAMVLCVVSESLGTAALSDYVKLQNHITSLNNAAVLFNDDIVGAGAYNIWTGVYVATVFGAAFFFDLVWPERREARGVKVAWRVCSALAVLFVAVDVAALTAIVAARSAYVYGAGVDAATADALLGSEVHIPLVYRHNRRCVAAVVFLWLGLSAVVGSAVVMWMGLRHDGELGPWSAHARREREEKGGELGGMGSETDDEVGLESYGGGIDGIPASSVMVDGEHYQAGANSGAPEQPDARGESYAPYSEPVNGAQVQQSYRGHLV